MPFNSLYWIHELRSDLAKLEAELLSILCIGFLFLFRGRIWGGLDGTLSILCIGFVEAVVERVRGEEDYLSILCIGF